ncbi:MAG TPA: F0F1 ATP synthase subunit A [Longimicrobium sp.]|nr:F0F1 ATP synthase subunit A [Longimicrobium sp.]
MIATAAILLALAGAPAQAAPAPGAEAPVEVLAQNRVDDAERAAARQRGFSSPEERAKGGGEKIDFLAHIQDSREWELPGGRVVHFPEKGSWMLGPLDVTPTKHVMFMAIAGVLTILTLTMGGVLATRAERGRTAGKRHNLIEALVLFIRGEVVMPNIGHGGEKYVPFIATLFFFILFCNLLGLIPYGSTATASVSVTAALAIITAIVVEIGGLIAVGPRQYLGTIFFVPKGMNKVGATVMAIALSPIEMAGKIARPFALTIRLMANMTAGHIVLLAIISLIFVFKSWALVAFPVLMGVAISFLELFVAFLQAFIFAILASVFIGMVRHAH